MMEQELIKLIVEDTYDLRKYETLLRWCKCRSHSYKIIDKISIYLNLYQMMVKYDDMNMLHYINSFVEEYCCTKFKYVFQYGNEELILLTYHDLSLNERFKVYEQWGYEFSTDFEKKDLYTIALLFHMQHYNHQINKIMGNYKGIFRPYMKLYDIDKLEELLDYYHFESIEELNIVPLDWKDNELFLIYLFDPVIFLESIKTIFDNNNIDLKIFYYVDKETYMAGCKILKMTPIELNSEMCVNKNKAL